jgi:type IV secretion system T-DNA border endonuclease VirD2
MSSLVDDTIADLLEGSVKFKRGRGGSSGLRKRAGRIARRTPEVMIKISGNTKGSGHVLSHLEYISRQGKVDLETEQGEILRGKEAIKQLHRHWTQDGGKRRKNTRDTTNIVLSMPAGTDAKRLKAAVRAFAKAQFGENHQYVMAQHTDADHPHVHLTVKCLGFDGRRLQVKKGDPQKWREQFARQLRRQNIEAEATPRAARGVVRKGVKQVLRHIRDKGGIPEVDKAKVRQVIEEAREERCGRVRPKPWEEKIRARQTQVRKGWLTAVQALLQSSHDREKALARAIAGFVKDMPPLKTERHEIKERLVAQMQARQEQSAGRGDSQEER